MQALSNAGIAAGTVTAVLTLFAGMALAQEELDDLEVTLDVVDGVVELDANIRGLRGPGERGDFSVETPAGDGTAEGAPPNADPPTLPNVRADGVRDAFAGDGLGEMADAEFEALDDFEEGEDVDEDQFDELPEPMPDPMP